jgi:ATP-binding cassette subfamily B protein
MHRRLLAPEVVQTSALDCGPAALKSLLEGFGISVSYGRLREACQTSVDGTSIDMLEEVAVQLGVAAEQIIVPADHLLVPESNTLPAIVVVLLPGGLTHFVVVWNIIGPFVQVMDPGSGRRWLTRRRFLSELYHHAHPVAAADWREWAASDEFRQPLTRRVAELSGSVAPPESLIAEALEDLDWRPVAALDAATRMVAALIEARAIEPGSEAIGLLRQLVVRATTSDTAIPDAYWSVRPAPESADEEGPMVFLRGAVLVRAAGLRERGVAAEADELALPPEIAAALSEPSPQPGRLMLRLLVEDGILTPLAVLLGLLLAAAAVGVQALLLRAMIDVGWGMDLAGLRLGAIGALFLFFGAVLLLEFPLNSLIMRAGRRMEARIRVALLAKIPRLGDRYFHSRLTSDMAQRAHGLRLLSTLPSVGVEFVRFLFQIGFTAAGIVWLSPASTWIVLLAVAFAIAIPIVAQPVLQERDLRVRAHLGALSRFYFDALLGLAPIRTHRAERAVRREHEARVVEWMRAGAENFQAQLVVNTLGALGNTLFAVWIMFDFAGHGGSPGGALLLLYWALNLPALSRGMATLALQYPLYRNRLLSVMELLDAPEETDARSAEGITGGEWPPGPVAIRLDGVTVQASGVTILDSIDLQIAAGEHVAIVGPSGAGKSSLVGLLLGWHTPAQGEISIHGEPLRGERLAQLRRVTAWVDPEVRLWNRSLLENIRYGAPPGDAPLPVEQADLFGVLEKLPQGLQTPLGEGGGLVSGGEGQRVRLARALYREGVRLVIMDEPFRGLDREKRRELLARARAKWHDATLLFISHDISEAAGFERVLVIENGRVAEDGPPDVLAAQPDSRFGELLRADEEIRSSVWGDRLWRRLRMEQGRVREEELRL